MSSDNRCQKNSVTAWKKWSLMDLCNFKTSHFSQVQWLKVYSLSAPLISVLPVKTLSYTSLVTKLICNLYEFTIHSYQLFHVLWILLPGTLNSLASVLYREGRRYLSEKPTLKDRNTIFLPFWYLRKLKHQYGKYIQVLRIPDEKKLCTALMKLTDVKKKLLSQWYDN